MATQLLMVCEEPVLLGYVQTGGGIDFTINAPAHMLEPVMAGATAWCNETMGSVRAAVCQVTTASGVVRVRAIHPDRHALIREASTLGRCLEVAAQEALDAQLVA